MTIDATSCQLIMPLLGEFVLGRVGGADASVIRHHVILCNGCFGRAALLAASTNESDPPEETLSPPRIRNDARAPDAPLCFGPYVTSCILGQGGMGVVYRATHSGTGQSVALKTVRQRSATLRESLRKEVEVLSGSRHPGVVQIHESDVEDGVPWYAMELLEGETLESWNRSLRHRWPAGTRRFLSAEFREVVQLYQALCAPLGHVHGLGVVHGDLKPANVFLRDGAEPVLTDFGLVTLFRGALERESLVVMDRCRGTLPYLSPEVIHARIPDMRADLYAFGCMLYESLTGRPPFVTWDKRELLRLHTETTPSPVSDLIADVPPELDRLLAVLLAKDPRDRPRHVGEVQRALSRWTGRTSTAPNSIAALARPTMVGRQAPYEVATNFVREQQNGAKRVLSVEGESGIGKTFFTSQVAQYAGLNGVRVLLGECPDHTQGNSSTALAPFAQLLDWASDTLSESESESGLTKQDIAILAPHSRSMSRLATRRGVETSATTPDAPLRERLLDVMARLVRNFIKQHRFVLMIVDDIQWVDELALAVLEHLLADKPCQRLGIILTLRTEEVTETVEAFLRQSAAERLQLGRLDRDSIEKLTIELSGMSAPPLELVEFAYSSSEGLPFFVAEYLRSIATAGRTDASFDWIAALSAITPTLRLPLPERLKALIRHRLSLLGDDVLRVLEHAAILGRRFEQRPLARALELSEIEIADALSLAAARKIVDLPDGDLPGFVHDKFRETLCDGLSPERLRLLHRTAAKSLEVEYAATPEVGFYLSRIARHYQIAEEFEQAVHYLPLAAERALAAAADADAVILFEECLGLVDKLARQPSALQRAVWQRGLADANLALGRATTSLKALVLSARHLGHSIPTTGWALGLDITKHLCIRLLPTWLMRRFGPADPELRAELGRVLLRAVIVAFFGADGAQLARSCLAALNIAEPLGTSPELASIYTYAALTCNALPSDRWTVNYLSRSQACLARAANPVAASHFHLGMGSHQSTSGALESARSTLEVGIQLAEDAGYLRRRDECVALRAGVELLAGLPIDAEPWIDQLRESAARRQDRQLQAWACAQHWDCLLLRGRLVQLNDEFDAYSGLSDLAPQDQVWLRGFAAFAKYALGHVDEAINQSRRVLRLSERMPPVFSFCHRPYVKVAQVLAAAIQLPPFKHERAQLGREARRAVRLAAQLSRPFPIGRPLTALCSGELALAQGNPRMAQRQWQAGLTAALGWNLPYDQACLLLALTRVNGATPPGALKARAAQLIAAHGLGQPAQLTV